MKLAKQGIIYVDLDEVVESNNATVTFGSFDLVPLHVPLKKLGACVSSIQCESLKPKQTQVLCQDSLLHLCSDNKSMSYDKEDWTLVTRKKPRKKQVLHSYPNLPRRRRHEWNTRQHQKKKEKKNPERK